MRADLAALTPDALIASTNRGLVHRAQRELEHAPPRVSEADDGTVLGVFADGTSVTLAPGDAVRDARCTCSASAVCRHVIATVLAYRAAVAEMPADDSASASPSGWASPDTISDEQLRTVCGVRAMTEARSMMVARAPLVVTVVATPVPEALLPTATVRFFVAGQPQHATCDCRRGGSCAHVVLGVWAFREADLAAGARAVVRLGESTTSTSGAAASLEAAQALSRWVATEGAAALPEGRARRFAETRERLRRDGALWVEAALESVERSIERLRTNSARFSPTELVSSLVEVEARVRAARSTGELPSEYVLGTHAAPPSEMRYALLSAVGLRVDRFGSEHEATVCLADPTTGALLVAQRAWSHEGPASPVALASRPFLGGSRLGTIARGRIASARVTRRADRSIIVSDVGGSTDVSCDHDDFAKLPPPLRVHSVAELAQQLASRPPRLLRPPVLAEDFFVLEVSRVTSIAFDPARQVLFAEVLDGAGDGTFLVERAHRAVTPGAIDALAAALTGRHGEPRFVTGEVRAEQGRLVLDAQCVVTDRVSILDLELPRPQPALPLAATVPPGALAGVLGSARGALEDLARHGMRASRVALTRHVAGELTDAGLSSLGRAFDTLSLAIGRARDGEPDAFDGAARAFLECGLLVVLATERLR